MWEVATTDIFDEWFQTLEEEERAAILLVGGDKRGKPQRSFYRQLIAKADVLYAEHLGTIQKTTRKRGGK